MLSATALTPFDSPQQHTNPAGSAAQAAAVGQATSTSAGNAQNLVASAQQMLSAIPTALQSLATPAQSGTLDTLSNLISIFLDLPANIAELTVDVPMSTLGVVSLPLDIGSYGTGLHTDDIVSGWAGQQPWPGTGPAPVKEFPAPLTNLRPGALAPRVSAGLGEAKTLGALSVPSTWTIATPAVRPISYTLPALPALPAAALEEGSTLVSSATLGQMALAGMAGRAIAGTLVPTGKRTPAAGDARMAKDASAVDAGEAPEKPRTVITGVAAELREFAKLRDEGILTDDEYAEQKNRLLGH